ncbi:uncharacterized protein LOC129683369 [Psammomys obesus]|uniref:uncharacterized protein LOC129683369 n=1 Tax=Psammomys obesus TaxID=48139 RepID=UPI002453647E|nr:uncharacterized protein LOC129683369 [Psammomys obesus]XP_055472033.1 uncharacterized protein LOC129683369 [Psammomys obesus]XP_055472034.1 uncharacterized protein LOC129683369 [Psammomys obesus]
MATDLHTDCMGLKRPLPRRRLAQSPHQQPQPEAKSASPPKASSAFPPRSNAYLIIGLQNELIKRGILKNMSDYEDFWKLVQEKTPGEEIKEKLQKIKLKLMNPRPWLPAASRKQETGKPVSADQDSGARQETQSLLSRLTEWRKRCQQHEASRRLQQGPEESKSMCKTKMDSRGKIYLSRLYQMYSRSLANMEFSRRLLERDGCFADMHAEHGAGGLADYMVPSGLLQADAPPRETEVDDPLAPDRQLRAPPALRFRFLKFESPGSPQRSSPLKTGRHQVTLCGMSKLSEQERATIAPAQMTTEPVRSKPAPARVSPDPRPAVPLTLEHMIQTHPVVEVKTAASQYWVNYVDEE